MSINREMLNYSENLVCTFIIHIDLIRNKSLELIVVILINGVFIRN